MIKINLSSAQKQVDISNLAGLDFSQIKIKMLLLVIGLAYVPDFFLYPAWETSLAEKNADFNTKQMALQRLKRQVSQNTSFEKQIRELKAQEENFRKKLFAVKEAISQKQNPYPLLHYIAKNIPPEVWITSLTIDNDKMSIKGQSLDYGSVGNFLTSLKSSVFIKDFVMGPVDSIVRPSDKRRIETFEVTYTIGRFDQ
jgi:Tfp pilus assembly protein PilN